MLGVLLSGKNPDLGFWEVLQLARRRGERVRRVSERFAVVRSSDLSFYRRLAYARLVGILRFSFRRFADLPRLVAESGLRGEVSRLPSFFVRSFPPRRSVERRVGWWLDGNPRADSENIVWVVEAGGRFHVLFPAYEVREKEFSWRDAKRRPFFHPTGLNARDARMLVNLSAPLPGERFLDPFCGTGAIPIEAALVGARAFGMDADPEMVEGARKNAVFAGANVVFRVGDARRIGETFPAPFDAIATDLPYGRSSRVLGSDMKTLYMDAFHSMHGALRRGRFCVVVADRDIPPLLERAGFFVMHVGKWYVHKSLTRRVHVCRA